VSEENTDVLPLSRVRLISPWVSSLPRGEEGEKKGGGKERERAAAPTVLSRPPRNNALSVISLGKGKKEEKEVTGSSPSPILNNSTYAFPTGEKKEKGGKMKRKGGPRCGTRRALHPSVSRLNILCRRPF